MHQSIFPPLPGTWFAANLLLSEILLSSQRQADLRAPATRSMPGPLTQSVQFFMTLEGDALTPVSC